MVDRALSLNPGLRSAWVGESLAYTRMGIFELADYAAQRALSLPPVL
jgi:Flp pilus assembly protein TadD